MEKSLYRYIWQHSRAAQIWLLLLAAASMPVVYISLELPKIIVNEAISGIDLRDEIFGIPIDRISYLFLLCGGFLLAVAIHGAMKYRLNVSRGIVGERILRRLRYELFQRILRFPLRRFKTVSQGELLSMVTTETEPMAEFIGESYTLPVFQGGLLFTYMLFIFLQDLFLGIAAVVLYPVQIYLIPKLQARVNRLAAERVRTVRVLTTRIGEGVAGIEEVRAHATSGYERADIASRLGLVYRLRVAIYKRKFMIKFLNNLIAQMTPFLFYAIGGYFVIAGDLTIGVLVAVLAAYKDLAGPWKELLRYYQKKEDIRVKYLQVVDQFDPPDMLRQQLLDNEPEEGFSVSGSYRLTNVSYSPDGFSKSLRDFSAQIAAERTVTILGSANGGKRELGALLGRLAVPEAGSIQLGGLAFDGLAQATLGKRIAYVGPEAYLFNGSVFDAMVYPLKRHPVQEGGGELDEGERRDAELTGNSLQNVEANWIDSEQAGCADEAELRRALLDALRLVALDGDVYEFGLLSRQSEADNPHLAARVLEARRALRARFAGGEALDFIEWFDSEGYSANRSVLDNIVFGSIRGGNPSATELAAHPLMVSIIERVGLADDFLNIGKTLAETMVELFGDDQADAETIERFSFIGIDELPRYRQMLANLELLGGTAANLPKQDAADLRALPFQLIVARHRLGLITEGIQLKLIEARKRFALEAADHGLDIEPFALERYSESLSLQENIIFGSLIQGRAQVQEKVGELIEGVVDELGLRDEILLAGLEHGIGVGGSRLNQSQRHRIALARALVKQPDLLIANGTGDILDPAGEEAIVKNFLEARKGRGLIWITARPALARYFQDILIVDGGQLVEQGAHSDLAANSEALAALHAAG